MNECAKLTIVDDAQLRAAEYGEPIPGRLPRWKAALGFIFVVMMPIGWLVVWSALHDYGVSRAIELDICRQPVPCEGDDPEIMLTDFERRIFKRRNVTIPKFVVHRRDEGCEREMEVFFHHDGELAFEGSLDEPDPELRRNFVEERDRWWERREIRRRQPCSQVTSERAVRITTWLRGRKAAYD